METMIDPATRATWKRVRFTPVLINYTIGAKKHEKKPDKQDLATLAKIADLALPGTVPVNDFPIDEMYHGSRLAPKGFTRVHHMYLPRAAQTMGRLWEKALADRKRTRLNSSHS